MQQTISKGEHRPTVVGTEVQADLYSQEAHPVGMKETHLQDGTGLSPPQLDSQWINTFSESCCLLGDPWFYVNFPIPTKL